EECRRPPVAALAHSEKQGRITPTKVGGHKEMKNHKSKVILSFGAGALMLAAVLGASVCLPSGVKARAQSSQAASIQPVPAIPAGQDGTAAAGTAPTAAAADLGEAETLTKASVEASPAAPDDTVGGTAGLALPAKLPGGLDHAAAGTGTRNAGFGTIRLRGISPHSVAVRAFLYWGTIIQAVPPVSTQTVTFNGVQVSGTLIGSCKPPCWPGSLFVVYRASVIARLSANINGDYSVKGLPSSVANGSSPWLAPAAPPLSEGATLLVVYSDPNLQTGSRVYLHDRPPVLVNGFSDVTITNRLSSPLPVYTAIKHTRVGADGQVGQDTFADSSKTGEVTILESTQIRGPGPSVPDPDSDWNGRDGGPLNQLWDTNTDSSDDTTILNPGITSYNVTYKTQGDCFVVVVHVLTAK